MKFGLLGLIGLFMCVSCQSEKQQELKYVLQETEDALFFEVSSNSSLYIKSMSLFKDDAGKEYKRALRS